MHVLISFPCIGPFPFERDMRLFVLDKDLNLKPGLDVVSMSCCFPAAVALGMMLRAWLGSEPSEF